MASLDIPHPFNLDEFCRGLSSRRGRPIILTATRIRITNMCGLWLSMPDADFVFYEHDTPVLHRQHIVLHEVGHILRHHEGKGSLSIETARILAPHVDPRLVQRVLGRDVYTDDQEREAELFASLMTQTVTFRAAPAADHVVHPPVEALVDPVSRIEASLAGYLRRGTW